LDNNIYQDYLILTNKKTNCMQCGSITQWYDEDMRAFICSEDCANLLYETLNSK